MGSCKIFLLTLMTICLDFDKLIILKVMRMTPSTKDEGEYIAFSYLIIVTDATDAVSVNFFGRCKFLQI